LGRILASPDKPQANRITIPICKESRSKTAISGKIDYFATPLPDSKSRAWEFFTGDELICMVVNGSAYLVSADSHNRIMKLISTPATCQGNFGSLTSGGVALIIRGYPISGLSQPIPLALVVPLSHEKFQKFSQTSNRTGGAWQTQFRRALYI